MITDILKEVRKKVHKKARESVTQNITVTKLMELSYVINPLVVSVKECESNGKDKKYKVIMDDGIRVKTYRGYYLFSTSPIYSKYVFTIDSRFGLPFIYFFNKTYLHVPDLFLYVAVANGYKALIYNNYAVGVMEDGKFIIYLTKRAFKPYYFVPDYDIKEVTIPDSVFEVLKLIGEIDVINKKEKVMNQKTITEYTEGHKPTTLVDFIESPVTEGLTEKDLKLIIYFLLPTVYFSFFEVYKKTAVSSDYMKSLAEEIFNSLSDEEKKEIIDYVKKLNENELKGKITIEI